MFYPFNAHKATRPQPDDTSKDRLAKKIAESILSVQRCWAGFMERHTRKFSVKSLKTILIVFTLGLGCYCIYLMGNGLIARTSSRFDTMDLKRLGPPGQKQKLEKQSAFSAYLDSLENELRRDSLENPDYYQP